MHRPITTSRTTRRTSTLAAPVLVGALALLASSSSVLAGGSPPCDSGRSWNRGGFRIIIGGGSRDGGYRRDTCRDDDLLYRGSQYGGSRYFGLDADAWCDLADGRYVRAKRDFLDLIECRPCEPVPYIGHSIASGRLEHWRETDRSMRKAIDLGVEALDAIRVDSGLKREVRCLIDQAECLLRQNHCDPDIYFVLASLQTILGQYDEALCSIENAQRYGDRSSAARDLKCHIESKLCRDQRDRDRGREPRHGRR